MKLYVKLFFGTGIPLGIFVGISLGLWLGFAGVVISGLIAGIFFGSLMSLILGTLHRWNTRKLAKGGKVGPSQSMILEMDPPMALAFDSCVQALDRFGAKIKIQQKNGGIIEATTGFSWKSWGEVLRVHFSVSDHEHEKIKVQISSSPRLSTTLVDYGKGRENVEKIAALLTSAG